MNPWQGDRNSVPAGDRREEQVPRTRTSSSAVCLGDYLVLKRPVTFAPRKMVLGVS